MPSPRCVLLLDEQPGIVTQVSQILSSSASTDLTLQVCASDEAYAALDLDSDPTTILLNYRLTWADPFTLLDQLQTDYPSSPILLCANRPDGPVAAAVEMSQQGILRCFTAFTRLTSQLNQILNPPVVTKDRLLPSPPTSNFSPVPVGTYRTTPSGQILAANAALIDILGYPDHETLLQTNAVNLYANPQERIRWQTEIEQNDIALSFEVQNRTYQGQIIWTRHNGRAVRDDNGQVLYYDGSCVSITEQKQLEEQLRQSQKMESIGRLSSGIAHDLNNLLTVVNGYSDLLLRLGSFDGQPRAEIYVKEIKEAGQRAVALTNQLLSFGRQKVVEPRLLNLNVVIANLRNMIERLINETIQLNTNLLDQGGFIQADLVHLEQVILNLIINARDAMPQGGELSIVVDEIRLDETNPLALSPNTYVRLNVIDTGIGIDEATRARLFEPFFTTKTEGTGLGLATVRDIVRRYEGGIDVESEPGQGTTFAIYWPRHHSEMEHSPQNIPDPEVKHGSEVILVVEDETGVRNLVSNVLQEHGYTVLAAEDGVDALEKAAMFKNPIDLLVTDVVMPRMTGAQLSAQLQREHPLLKVLYISGYTTGIIEQHGVLNPDINFLEKPFSTTLLTNRVREVLDA